MAKTPVAPRAAKPARASAADGSTAPPVKPKRPRKPKSAAAKTGRPSHVPTEQSRNLVMVLRANGVDAQDIAYEIGISERTLDKHYAVEMARGKARIKAKMGANVVKKALGGDNTCMIFWLKTQGGGDWSERGPNAGGPGPGGGDGGDEGGGSTEPVKVTIIGGLPD